MDGGSYKRSAVREVAVGSGPSMFNARRHSGRLNGLSAPQGRGENCLGRRSFSMGRQPGAGGCEDLWAVEQVRRRLGPTGPNNRGDLSLVPLVFGRYKAIGSPEENRG